MLYAWINGEKRPPEAKGERTTCKDCGGVLRSVMPAENVPHWRHKSGDCDPWSEPEGLWHLGWKNEFDLNCREVSLIDVATNERHRADVVCGAGTSKATVLELQHSSISEEERNSREEFYRQKHRMFWLVHIHSDNSFLGFNFGISLDFSKRPVIHGDKRFAIIQWMGQSKQFIEKWKKSRSHVFFDYGGGIFYLASEAVSREMAPPFSRGEFALCQITRADFIKAVYWND